MLQLKCKSLTTDRVKVMAYKIKPEIFQTTYKYLIDKKLLSCLQLKNSIKFRNFARCDFQAKSL